jgi:hypothetical protein
VNAGVRRHNGGFSIEGLKLRTIRDRTFLAFGARVIIFPELNAAAGHSADGMKTVT